MRGKAYGMAALDVYMTLRDATQAAGVVQPDYKVFDAPYYFTAYDNSVFIILKGGWFSSPEVKYVAGPRAGQTRESNQAYVEYCQKKADAVWGRLIPGSLFREPRFIPGTKRKKLPYTNLLGNEILGYVDEDGVHFYGHFETPHYHDFGY